MSKKIQIKKREVKPGNILGYTNHQNNFINALEKNGWDLSDNYSVVLHIQPPMYFEPIPNKINILWTMFEGETIPDVYAQYLHKADLIMVPCRHNVKLFQKYTHKPVEYLTEGVDLEKYTLTKRKFNPDKEIFNLLWVGASNKRKGYEHAYLAWIGLMDRRPELFEKTRFIMKTTRQNKKEERSKFGNIHFDSRFLKEEEMIGLYKFSHAMIAPSMGEGFGLPVAEAMATGCPVIHTNYTGLADLGNPLHSYPVDYQFNIVNMKVPGKYITKTYEVKCADPDINQMIDYLEEIYYYYSSASLKGVNASEYIRSNFTWDLSAREFENILRRREYL
jgi:glycosyltransferase involved in cell wall biosynthesis